MKYFSYVVLIALIAVVSCSAQIAVIVNKANPISKISQSFLSEIYLLNSTRWSDGTKILVFDSKEAAVQKAMYSFIGKDNLSLRKRWMQVQLSGEGKAPEGLDDANDMLKRVASNPGAIGYVKLSDIRDSDVKVIAKLD